MLGYFDMPIVFMYGPDTYQGRMFDRVGSSSCMGGGCVSDHKLVFNKPNMKRPGEGFANLVVHEGVKTFGVLFELNRKQLEMLDGYYGGYSMRDIEVVKDGSKNTFPRPLGLLDEPRRD